MRINLQQPRTNRVQGESDRIVASPNGNHLFTFRPDWAGPKPLPFRAAAATVDLLGTMQSPRVLILGFGMGAMGSMMKDRVPHCSIVGVEPDRKLYKAALETLGEGIDLHRADAVSFLRRNENLFDLILDDCFVIVTDHQGDSEPYRPIKLEVIPELAKAQLEEGGIYVRNLLEQEDLNLSTQKARILEHFAHTAERKFREWDNVLTVATDRELDAGVVAKLGGRNDSA